MRLFAGLALPPEAVERLAEFRLRLASPNDGLRWSAPDQWHITLRFFGEVEEEQARTLAVKLATVQTGPVTVSMDALGVFGGKGILYASVEPSENLTGLHTRVEASVAAAGALPESHPFRPHITLARSRNRTGTATLQRLSRPALPSLGREIRWRADEFLLYESVSGQSGAQYEVRARYPLSGLGSI